MKMTILTNETIARLKDDIVGNSIEDIYHEKEGDYFVIEFEGGGEVSVRFMSDCISQPGGQQND
jgi:hypothetical protein